MDCDCKSVFNRLSKGDRLKLRGAAMTTAISGFILEDTKAHPVRYPFYAAYLAVVITPLPFPFASTIVLAATLAWARYSKSVMATRLHTALKDTFNHAALVCNHKSYIYQDKADPQAYHVKNGDLAWYASKRAYADTRQATIHALKALKKLIM